MSAAGREPMRTSAMQGKSAERGTPSERDAEAWLSRSTRSTRLPIPASAAARLTAVVVFETPPFLDVTAVINARPCLASTRVALFAVSCRGSSVAWSRECGPAPSGSRQRLHRCMALSRRPRHKKLGFENRAMGMSLFDIDSLSRSNRKLSHSAVLLDAAERYRPHPVLIPRAEEGWLDHFWDCPGRVCSCSYKPGSEARLTP